MANYIQNDCVGCPQGCVSCGRDKDYIVYECDACGAVSYDKYFLKLSGCRELCPECLELEEGEY